MGIVLVSLFISNLIWDHFFINNLALTTLILYIIFEGLLVFAAAVISQTDPIKLYESSFYYTYVLSNLSIALSIIANGWITAAVLFVLCKLSQEAIVYGVKEELKNG